MKAVIRKMGNSQGVLIPKPVLAQVGFEDEAIMTVEDHALVLRPVRRPPREAWAEASRRIAEAGDDAPVWPVFEHTEDEQWTW
ncbi:MAG: AbrB/MazE/SpoVT family DNA-binding domain-containing protein [Gammaproteobacteria bacterium]